MSTNQLEITTARRDKKDARPPSQFRRLAMGALALACIGGGLVTASTTAGAVTGFTAAATLNVRSGPSTGNSVISSVPSGAALDIKCQTTGTNILGSTIWDQLNGYGNGFITDYYVNGTPYAVFDAAIPRCGSSTPSPGRTMGVRVAANYFPWGQCTWGAQNYQHSITGYYVDVWGNAYQWGSEAASKGWTVTPWNQPQARSIVVFQPGVAGANASDGHVGYVDAVSGDQVHFVEMNAVAGFGHYDSRWVTIRPGMSFILLP